MTFRSKPGFKYPYTSTFILKPVDAVTKLTLMGDITIPGGILGKAFGGSIRNRGEKMIKKALEQLKSILEK